MTDFTRTITRFADLAEFLAEETAQPTDSFAAAFAESADTVRLAWDEEAITADMPDPLQVERGIEMLMTTLFDLLRDTRLASVADRLAWGIVHSFHKVADQLDNEADRAARDIGEMIRGNDGSEIATRNLEDAQTLCHGLDEARDAVACMRDHAAQIFHIETGRPWSSARATLVSSKRTASVIAARDFLAARRLRWADRHAPEGPVVIVSGGQNWEDHQRIWDQLDAIKARIPTMILATTAQNKGCDAIAAAWAARSEVKLIAFALDRRFGDRAGFVRNEAMMRLNPVEALVCEGSGLQSHLARLVRAKGIPAHLLKASAQRRRSA